MLTKIKDSLVDSRNELNYLTKQKDEVETLLEKEELNLSYIVQAQEFLQKVHVRGVDIFCCIKRAAVPGGFVFSGLKLQARELVVSKINFCVILAGLHNSLDPVPYSGTLIFRSHCSICQNLV